jgi:hypothetical protein
LQLARKHYERLSARGHIPKLLIALLLPEEEDRWISHSADALVLRRCAYYLNPVGLPPISTDSKVVEIPISQVLFPAVLVELMLKASRGESL